MKIILLIFLMAEIINVISATNFKRSTQLKNNIKIGDSCQTYQNQSGICTKYKSDCTEDLFKKLIKTRTEYSLFLQSKCGKSGFCCKIRQSRKLLLPTAKQCGQSDENRIMGGMVTELSAYPWMALLKFIHTIENTIRFSCGGSLINERYVLTAAHCFHIHKFRFMNEVRLGEWDLKSQKDCYFNGRFCNAAPLNIAVEQIIEHFSFKMDPTPRNDIALLRLSRKIEYTDYVQPICLPISRKIIGKSYNEIVLTAAGWGITETGRTSDKKLFTTIVGVVNSKCDRVFESRTGWKLNNQTQMCAGGDGKRDTCQGDSGGAIMYRDLDSYHSQWIAVGIVSYGHKQCAKMGWPAVYTRVDAYLEWILRNINE